MAIDKLNTSTPIKSLLKTNELIDAVNNLNLNYLQRNKDYSIGDICYYNGLSPKYILKCIQEGETAAAEPSSISSLNLGDELEDGAAKFLITKNINHDENYLYVGKEEDIVDSDLLHENMIVVDPDEDILHDTILKEDFIMVGATTDSNGIEGFVPAPLAGEANRFLASDGTWKVVETNSGNDEEITNLTNRVTTLENKTSIIDNNKRISTSRITATQGIFGNNNQVTINNAGINVTGSVNASSGFVGNLNGTATKATQDSDGNVISDTYAKSVFGYTPDESGNIAPTNLGGISTINGTSFTPTNQNSGIKIADVTLEQGNITANKLTAGFTQLSAGTITLDSTNSWNSSGLTINGKKAVLSINNIVADSNGNVTLEISGGGDISELESRIVELETKTSGIKKSSTSDTTTIEESVSYGEIRNQEGRGLELFNEKDVSTSVLTTSGILRVGPGSQSNMRYENGTFMIKSGSTDKVRLADSGNIYCMGSISAGNAKFSVDANGNITKVGNITGYVKESLVGNAANKIPQYNSEGHLVLPSGAEIW